MNLTSSGIGMLLSRQAYCGSLGLLARMGGAIGGDLVLGQDAVVVGVHLVEAGCGALLGGVARLGDVIVAANPDVAGGGGRLGLGALGGPAGGGAIGACAIAAPDHKTTTAIIGTTRIAKPPLFLFAASVAKRRPGQLLAAPARARR
jgi:hypothetical protein